MDNYITQYIIAYNLKLNTNNHLFLKKNLKLKRIKIQPTKLHISTILLICKNYNQTNSENPLISETHNDLRLVQAGKCNRAFAILARSFVRALNPTTPKHSHANTYTHPKLHIIKTQMHVCICVWMCCVVFIC